MHVTRGVVFAGVSTAASLFAIIGLAIGLCGLAVTVAFAILALLTSIVAVVVGIMDHMNKLGDRSKLICAVTAGSLFVFLMVTWIAHFAACSGAGAGAAMFIVSWVFSCFLLLCTFCMTPEGHIEAPK